MAKKTIVVLLVGLALGSVHLAEAQQTKKSPRIGYLTASTPAGQLPSSKALREGLRQLGYIEGQNIAIEFRYAEEKPERLSALAAELVRLKVDVIVTGGPTATRAAKEATFTIPIVMAQDGDPVGSGFVASLARPGGNITGLSSLGPEISGTRLELLQEIVPKVNRVAVLGTSTNPTNAQGLKETELAAKAFGVQLQYLDVLGPEDIEIAFREAGRGRADAVLVLGGPVVQPQRTKVTALAVKTGCPQFTTGQNSWKLAGLSLTARALPI